MTQEEKDKIFDALDTIDGCHPNFSESIIDNTWCEAIRLFKGIISKVSTEHSLSEEQQLVKVLDNHKPELVKIQKELIEICADKFKVYVDTNFGRITFEI